MTSSQQANMGIPVDTWSKLNVQKTFRRRPGRLLNVLCTFSLRCVSRQVGPGGRLLAVNYFRKKISIVDIRLGSKYVSEYNTNLFLLAFLFAIPKSNSF